MEFAILGVQPQTLALVRAALAAGHRIVWLDEAAGGDAEIANLAPDARRNEAWEVLLDRSDRAPQGVIVSRGDEQLRTEQLRRLVQVGAHVLAVQPVVLSMLVYYELDMIRRDVRGVLRHYAPGLSHAFVDRAAELTMGTSSPLGVCEQVVLERKIDRNRADLVQETLIRDVGLIHRVCGGSTRVIALGASSEDNANAITGLQTTSTRGLTARWSLMPSDPGSGAQLTLFGTQGKATLVMDDGADWQWEVLRDGQAVESDHGPGDTAARAIEEFAACVEQGDDGADWQVATQALNLVDAAARSLKRGRAIDLHDEEVSEQSTFKAIMAAAGCGLILLVMMAPLLAGFLGDAVGIGQSAVRAWPIILLIILAGFLALQLLIAMVFKSGRKGDERS